MKNLYHTRRIRIKLIHIVFIMLVVYLLAFGLAQAQSEQIVVPLSNPNQPGQLSIQIIRGSITVRGYNGEEVIIQTVSKSEEGNNGEDAEERNGLRRIRNNSIGLEAVEENNRVHIKTNVPNHAVSLEIQVPTNFSVKAKTINDGKISIENVRGEIEAINVNGDIYLNNISGSAVANTVNGELIVTFSEVTPDTPMSFTSLNGDIDVTFPATTKMLAKMKTMNGEIFTDFDMNVTTLDNRKTSHEGGVYKVKIDNQVTGMVNGGGPEIYFENHNGDIFIRKR